MANNIDDTNKSVSAGRGFCGEAPAPYLCVGVDGIIRGANAAAEGFFGYSVDELVGMEVFRLVDGAAVPQARALLERMKTGEGWINEEMEYRRKDGQLQYGLLSVNPVRDANGMVVETFSIIVDITGYKNSERALRESEEKYRSLFETMEEGVVYQEADGRIISANPAAARILGLEYNDLLGSTSFDTEWEVVREDGTPFAGDDHPLIVAFRTGKPVKNVTIGLLNPVEKEWRWVIANSVPEFKPGDIKPFRVFSSFIDITERKNVEDALRESEEKYRTLFETLEEGIVYQNAEGEIISANPAAEKILGLNLDQMLGRTSVDPNWKAIGDDGTEFEGNNHPSMVALKTGKPVTGVIMGVYHPEDKDWRWIIVNAVPEFIQGEPKPFQVFTSFVDITDRKNTENALRESEEKFRIVVERAQDGIAIIQDAKMVYINPFLADTLGYTNDEVIGKPFADYIDRSSLETVKERYQKRMAGEQVPQIYEANLIKKDGSKLYTELNANIITYGGAPCDLVLVRDITERKRAEIALREEKELSESILYTAKDTIIVFDPSTGEAIRWNKAVRELTGYTDEEIKSMKVPYDWFCEEDIQKAVVAIEQVFCEGWSTVELSSFTKDGTTIPVEYTGSLIRDIKGDPRYIIAIGRNITERRKAENAIKEEKEFTDSILYTAKDTIFVFNPFSGEVVRWNKAFSEICGYSEEEIKYMKVPEDWHSPEDAEKAKVAIEKLFREGWSTVEISLLTKDGKAVPFEYTGSLIRDARGNPRYVISIGRDFTERRKADKALREEKEFSENILNTAADTVFVFDPITGKPLRWNKAFSRISGYSDEEITAMKAPDDWYDAEDLKRAEAATDKIFREGQETVEMSLITKSGKAIPTEYTGSLVNDYDGNPRYVISVGRDITERKRAEERLRRSLTEKELLLDEVNHRVKNNLQVIMALLGLQADQTRNEEARKVLNESVDRLRTMSLIHNRLYKSDDLTSIDLGGYVKELSEKLFSSYSDRLSDIGLVVDVAAVKLPVSKAIPFGMIINELLTNSFKYAFPEGLGGEITVSLRADKGNGITLVIADNGIGMPDNLDIEKTDTLGLQIVNSLVRQLDGTLSIERNEGVVFTIIAPV